MTNNANRFPVIRVTCAIIQKSDHILIACRSDQRVKRWEFPGGKTEPGEADELCVVREIKEELSLKVEIIEKLPVFNHRYPDKTIDLVPFICRYKNGKIKLKDHLDAKWIKKEALKCFDLMEADRSIADYYMTT